MHNVCLTLLRRAIAPLAAALLIALPYGCARAPEQVYKTQFFTLGTVVDVSLWGVDNQRAADAVKTVENVLNEVHRRWHAWEPSELTRINAGLAAGQAVTISEDESQVLQQAKSLAEQSEELFNPAIGKLIGLWGFHSSDVPKGPPPPQADIDRLLAAQASMADLTIDATTIRSRNPAVEIDLGAVAKGYGVDLAIDALRKMGIRNAIVNAGGGLHAIGKHGNRPWRIGIREPTHASGIIASVNLRDDEAVHTSGNYERFYDYQGRRYHHIIDPRSGYPSSTAISATVIHRDGALADAAATAIMIAGPQKWTEVARRMGVSQVMMIGADKKVYMTPAMAQRIHFEISPAPEVVTSEPL